MPVVIDADGLNAIKDNLDILKQCKNKIILTPHIGEMAKLTGFSMDYIKENQDGGISKLCKKIWGDFIIKGL